MSCFDFLFHFGNDKMFCFENRTEKHLVSTFFSKLICMDFVLH